MIDDKNRVVDVDDNINPIGLSVDISLATGISIVSSEFGAAAAAAMENKCEVNVLFPVWNQESTVFYSIFLLFITTELKKLSLLFVFTTLNFSISLYGHDKF